MCAAFSIWTAMPLLMKAGMLLLLAVSLTSCHATSPRPPVPRTPVSSSAAFVETFFASVPREALAELQTHTAQQLLQRSDSTVYSSGGALLELRDSFAYVPSIGETAPGRDRLETGSRNLRIGLRPRPGAEGTFDLRLESLPSFNHALLKTAVLRSGDGGALLDTHLTRDGKVLVVFVRAYPVHGRADLERIYQRKLAERAAAQERAAPQPVSAPR